MLCEEGLTLEARARLTGTKEDAAEAQRILSALDVVRVPELPQPRRLGGRGAA
jgi:hypothetical protein